MAKPGVWSGLRNCHFPSIIGGRIHRLLICGAHPEEAARIKAGPGPGWISAAADVGEGRGIEHVGFLDDVIQGVWHGIPGDADVPGSGLEAVSVLRGGQGLVCGVDADIVDGGRRLGASSAVIVPAEDEALGSTGIGGIERQGIALPVRAGNEGRADLAGGEVFSGHGHERGVCDMDGQVVETGLSGAFPIEFEG